MGPVKVIWWMTIKWTIMQHLIFYIVSTPLNWDSVVIKLIFLLVRNLPEMFCIMTDNCVLP